MDTSTSIADVSDNAGQNRFELRLNGDLVGILGYYDTNCPSGVPGPCNPTVDFMHTVIVEDFGHRGLAAVLVGGALDIARQRGWRVRPVCTYVQRFLDGHAGYESVVVPDSSGRAQSSRAQSSRGQSKGLTASATRSRPRDRR